MDKERKDQDALLKMIKIFLIEYLTTVHGFKGFQAEAINILALYVLKLIKNLVIPTKRLVTLQGRVTPNCLHLIDTIKSQKQIKLINLIEFLDEQAKFSNENIRISSNSLNNLGRQFFENDAQSINGYQKQTFHQSIRAVPYCYTFDYRHNPLHMKAPIDESFKKPSEYTYKDMNKKVEKEQKSIEQLANYSMRQTRRSLGILNLQEANNDQAKKGQKKVKISREKKEDINQKFSMINFI